MTVFTLQTCAWLCPGSTDLDTIAYMQVHAPVPTCVAALHAVICQEMFYATQNSSRMWNENII